MKLNRNAKNKWVPFVVPIYCIVLYLQNNLLYNNINLQSKITDKERIEHGE